MFKSIGKEINAILGPQTILKWTYGLSKFLNYAMYIITAHYIGQAIGNI